MQGEKMKSALCRNAFQPIDLYYNMDEGMVDEFIVFLNKNNKTAMELFLGNKIKYSIKDLYEMKGTFALRRAEFKKALNYFKSGNQYTFSEGGLHSYGDPFESVINICVTCGEGDGSQGMTKVEFAKQMMEYEKLAKSDPANSAKYYYLLGLGMYNITMYGSSYNLTSYTRSAYSTGNHNETGIAQQYFKKALKFARDKELAAKACFMAAKCAQGAPSDDNITKLFVGDYYDYFKLLKDKYSDTKYYNEVLQECKYFSIFVKNN